MHMHYILCANDSLQYNNHQNMALKDHTMSYPSMLNDLTAVCFSHIALEL